MEQRLETELDNGVTGARKAEAGELQIQDQPGPHREMISF